MKRRFCKIMAFVLTTLAVSQATLASAEDDRTDRLQAAYTLNFLKFVEWPGGEAANMALRVVVIGDGSIVAALRAAVDGKTVQARRVTVTTFSDVASWRASNSTSEVIFVTASIKPNWGEVLDTLAGKPVLTISDYDGFCATGGMLDMFESDNRIRFEANPAAAAAAGLKIRSELLKLAIIAKTGPSTP